MKSARFTGIATSRIALPFATLALAVLAGCGGGGNSAGTTGGGGVQLADTGGVVETVNGEAVPQRLLDALAQSRGIDLANPQMREKALKQLTDTVLLAQAAKKQGFGSDPEFAAAVELGRLQGVASATMRQLQTKSTVDDAAIRAEYDQQAAKGGASEYDFSQIVFATQEQATKAAAEVAGGKAYDQVFETYRKDAKMARNFPKMRASMLPPPLATALAALKPGETTKTPLQQPQGWALLHLNTVNAVPQPPFEQMKEGLRRTLSRKQSEESMTKLRDEAKITLTDPPPASTLPPPPPQPARPAGMMPMQPAPMPPTTTPAQPAPAAMKPAAGAMKPAPAAPQKPKS
ncbi:MAG: peptidylprolyl isomerase [Dokdonella sp.]